MFKSSYNKGFAMTFKNGLTISVQWGVGNYCERKSVYVFMTEDMENINNESVDAEIAIWSKDGTDFNFENDWVKGYVSADEVAGWITMVSTAKDINDLNTIVSEAKTKAFVMQFNPDNY